MTARERFCEVARAQLGKSVLWAMDGPEVFDCSGLVCYSLLEAGGPDLRATHTAQRFADETPDVVTFASAPVPGDLCFYGINSARVTHVAIWLEGGEVLSADGATSRIRELSKVARSSVVRLHDDKHFRRDWISTHRFTFVDDIDRTKGANNA